ncbi:MAG TPA: DNA-processing protein DprA [Gaiellaceae bacterium]|nr:DNA-processing protein DprA [Gaiellaceae bacterium]
MNELAAAVFAAESAAHVVDVPRSRRFAEFRRTFDAEAYLRRLAANGLAWVPRGDRRYPPRLDAIHDPPLGLFVRSRQPLEPAPPAVVAIVGARACTPYGADVARTLARDLTRAGALVVSGLARGIDGAAHRGALEAGGTLAVLGCGIDRDYPRAHATLAAAISERGWIVSEYAPGVEPAPWRFPARNRIVAGLADAVVVVEARERSGALITADLALEEGREVLAVPGEVHSHLSRGAHNLLRAGATLVRGAEDVLEVLGVEPVAGPTRPALEGRLERVLAAVAVGACTAEEAASRAAVDIAAAGAALAELEVLGTVTQTEGIYREVMCSAALSGT